MSHTRGAAEALDNAAAPPLTQLLRTEGQVRMLDIFLTRDSLWITAEKLSEYAGINESTIYRNIDLLRQASLVEARGNDPTEYRLHSDSDAARYLQSVHSVLADRTREIQALFSDDSDVDIADMTSGSPFVLLFKQPTRVALLDMMLSRGPLWATRERLAELIDVRGSTVQRNLEPLEEAGLVEKREGSWPYEYRLNQDLNVVSDLQEAHLHLSDYTKTLQEATQSHIEYPDNRSKTAQNLRKKLAELEVSLDAANEDSHGSHPIQISRESGTVKAALEEHAADELDSLTGDDGHTNDETNSGKDSWYGRSKSEMSAPIQPDPAQAA